MLKKNTAFLLLTSIVACIICVAVFASNRFVPHRLWISTQSNFLEDNFDQHLIWQQGSTYGIWHVNFNGNGKVGLEFDNSLPPESQVTFFERPQSSTGDNDPSTNDNDTHAALVTSMSKMGDFTLFLKMRTIQQLRTPVPNYWETAWVIWHYTDDNHFYYFTLKTNGWELGKRDPSFPGGQQFLKTGESPKVNLGAYDGVKIEQLGATITVTINEKEIVTFTDPKNPYLSGNFGLYNEDAYVHFGNISMKYKSVN